LLLRCNWLILIRGPPHSGRRGHSGPTTQQQRPGV